MAFCANCGSPVDEGAPFCGNCGNPVAPKQSSGFANEGGYPEYQAQPVYQNQTNMSFDPQDVEQNKVMAVLAYLGILALIPYFAAPNSKFARTHAIQGLNLLILCAIAEVISIVLVVVLIGVFLAWAVGIFAAVLSIMGIINAFQGTYKELPLISKIKIIKN